MSPVIRSTANPIFKKLLSLTKSKGVKKENLALVSGAKITQEVAGLSHWPLHWVLREDMATPAYFQSHQDVLLDKKLFEELDVCGTHAPLLCVKTPKIKPLTELNDNKATLYVALSDPSNLGALLRTCAAFDWPQVVLLEEAAHPFLPKSLRASSGTALATDLFQGPSIEKLKEPELVALDGGGRSLITSDLRKNLKLLIGEEGQGVPQTFRGERLRIPISNRVESLNATIAASLVIHQWSQVN